MLGLVFDQAALCTVAPVDDEGFCILMVALKMSMASTIVIGRVH